MDQRYVCTCLTDKHGWLRGWQQESTWKMRVPRKESCRRLYRAGMYMLATRLDRAVLTN